MKQIAFVLVTILLFGAALSAHGNLQHVMGTVIAVTDKSISVRTSDGSVKIVAFDGETHFFKGGAPASAKDVLIGARVVIHAHVNGDKMHAAEIKIGISTTGSKPQAQ